jgi:hypothetical protein
MFKAQQPMHIHNFLSFLSINKIDLFCLTYLGPRRLFIYVFNSFNSFWFSLYVALDGGTNLGTTSILGSTFG